MSSPTNHAIFCLADVAAATGGTLHGQKLLPLEGVSTDSRQVVAGSLFVALSGDNFDGHAFVARAAAAGASAAVVKRGFAASANANANANANVNTEETPGGGLPADFGLVEVDDTLAALGALAKVHRSRFPRLKIGAITGSNGKTTTKEIAAAIFAAAFGPTLKTEGNLNNEIGLPLTLLRLDASHQAAVVELGMNHSGEIARLTAIAGPDAGLVTCAQPVHLEGLGSVEAVAKAKGELFQGLPRSAVAVANLDDARITEEARKSGRKLITYGGASHQQADVRLSRIISHDRRGLAFEVSIQGAEPAFVRIPLIGVHNAQNACAALALGLALGGDPDRMLDGLTRATGFARRLEIKQAPSDITVIDDCYNANPASMEAALRTARELAGEGRVVAVLGEMFELGSQEEQGHRQVGARAAAERVDALLAFGPLSRFIADEATARGVSLVHHTESVEDALAWLQTQLRSGDLVICKASRGARLERIVDPLVAGENL